ncbi:MAG: hypothetical protein AB8E82_09040 [Aureispira sp.]
MKTKKQFLVVLLLLTIINYGYTQKTTVEPGTYYTNQNRVGKITITVDDDEHQTIMFETNPENDLIWEECVFSPSKGCVSTLGKLYSAKVLAENNDMLTEGEHILMIRVEGYNGNEQFSTPPMAEGSVKIRVTKENKTKTLSQSYLAAGMSNPALETSTLRTLQSSNPDSDYHKVIIGSRNYEIVRNELTGVVLHRQVGVIAFGRNKKGCFFRLYRVVQSFNGASYENAYKVYNNVYDYEVNGQSSGQVPCESVPK